MRNPLPLFATLITLALLTGISGCLVGSNTTKSVSGNYVPQTTFDQIKPGTTTLAWVKATLGEPSSVSTADGHNIWKYAYSEKTDSSGYVFLIFGGSNTTETRGNAFVEFNDGLVVNKWRTVDKQP